MICVIHGSDSQSSYLRLQSLVSSLKRSERITVNKDNLDTNYQALFSNDLFDTKKIIICENLITTKKIDTKDFKNIDSNNQIFFWENQEISASILKNFQNIATVENFKLPSTLFYFLDSITPNYQNAIKYISKLDPNLKGLAWQLENRLFLLILVKLNLTSQEVLHITGKNLAPWQWQKISAQANLFNQKQLQTLFSSVLKIELLLKTGETSMSESTLISLMLTKQT